MQIPMLHDTLGVCALCDLAKGKEGTVLGLGEFNPNLASWYATHNSFYWGTDECNVSPSIIINHYDHGVRPEIREELWVGVDLSLLMPHGSVYLNGPARSIPLHAHYQAVLRKFPITLAKHVTISSGSPVRMVEGWPMMHYAFEGAPEDIVREATRSVVGLVLRGVGRAMMDLIFEANGKRSARIYIVPRTRRVPADLEKTGFGGAHSAGYFIFSCRKEFDLVDPEVVPVEVGKVLLEKWLLDTGLEPPYAVPVLADVAQSHFDTDGGFTPESAFEMAYKRLIRSKIAAGILSAEEIRRSVVIKRVGQYVVSFSTRRERYERGAYRRSDP